MPSERMLIWAVTIAELKPTNGVPLKPNDEVNRAAGKPPPTGVSRYLAAVWRFPQYVFHLTQLSQQDLDAQLLIRAIFTTLKYVRIIVQKK